MEAVSTVSHERYELGIFRANSGYELRAAWREGDGWTRRREAHDTLSSARATMYERIEWIRANPR